jgi:hypothetical protein
VITKQRPARVEPGGVGGLWFFGAHQGNRRSATVVITRRLIISVLSLRRRPAEGVSDRAPPRVEPCLYPWVRALMEKHVRVNSKPSKILMSLLRFIASMQVSWMQLS